jgi:hypothetical protein
METYEGEFKKIVEKLVEYRDPVDRFKEKGVIVSAKIKSQNDSIAEYLDEVGIFLNSLALIEV